ncbi:hypothetical protein GH714_034622 [Hevea brasiliensis]|uniref:Transcription repressor n=1 Tax=Hevea brasiliensis TaxID=3981 RepID=A0A6A6NCY7_HEVBR|nr:hypothetical protein GH714_034622 [Hevea brasiliensis]
MPTKLQKSLQDYLSKIKNPTPPNSMSSSKTGFYQAAKNPKTPSFARDRSLNEGHERDGAATLSDIDRFLFENFKSLYIKNDEEDHPQKKTCGEEEEEGGGDGDYDNRVRGPRGVLYHDHYDSPRLFEIPPDLCGSHRFFVTAGSSSSLIEEARDKVLSEPNEDFRLSMQEMVEARLQRKGKVNWDFMQELLFSYLDLNEKKSHKFILSAFVDLVVGLRQRSGEVPAKPRRSCRIGERGRKLRNVT